MVRNELELSRVVVRRQAVVCRAAASAGQTVLIPKLRPNSISTYAMLLVVLSLRILEDLNRFKSNFFQVSDTLVGNLAKGSRVPDKDDAVVINVSARHMFCRTDNLRVEKKVVELRCYLC